MAAAPISFYFGVQEGERANLETVALASVEWISLVRDLAAVVAPDLEFEIEFIESEDGSVWLSNLIKAIHSGDRKALAALVAAVVTFFGSGPALHIQTDFGDEFWAKLGHEHEIELTDADKDDIAQRVVAALDETQAEERRRKILQVAERDRNVTSVGVDFRPRREGPLVRIPRETFPAYDAILVAVPEKPAKDVRHERNIQVEIVKPSLRKNEAKPRWRFRGDDGEWSATVEDAEFIWALNADRTGLHLAVGQKIRLDLAIDLKLVEGEWVEENRRIVRVHDPKINRAQGELGLGSE